MTTIEEPIIRLKVRTIDSNEFNIMINKESNVEQLKHQIENVNCNNIDIKCPS
jgi:hypothetical protein